MAAADTPEEPGQVRDPSLADAIIRLVTLLVLIAGSLALFDLDALDGPIQVALILCVLTVGLIVLKNGHSWDAALFAGVLGAFLPPRPVVVARRLRSDRR